jgi:hypothetical protein
MAVARSTGQLTDRWHRTTTKTAILIDILRRLLRKHDDGDMAMDDGWGAARALEKPSNCGRRGKSSDRGKEEKRKTRKEAKRAGTVKPGL